VASALPPKILRNVQGGLQPLFCKAAGFYHLVRCLSVFRSDVGIKPLVYALTSARMAGVSARSEEEQSFEHNDYQF